MNNDETDVQKDTITSAADAQRNDGWWMAASTFAQAFGSAASAAIAGATTYYSTQAVKPEYEKLTPAEADLGKLNSLNELKAPALQPEMGEDQEKVNKSTEFAKKLTKGNYDFN